MASGGDKEHRMLFDLQGRRRNVIKVIYAVLAVLMGLSLFLIGTGSGLGPLFNSGGSGNSELVERYEEQIERIDRKLVKTPNDPELLASLTRAHLSSGDAQADSSAGAIALTPDSIQEYQLASQAWSEYLEATDEPSAALAGLVAPRLISLAEFQTTVGGFRSSLKEALEAQEIVAEQRPTMNSLSTLAIYQYFNFNYEKAEQVRAEAKQLARSKSEKETLDRTINGFEQTARQAEKQVKAAERQNSQAGAAGGGQSALEQPLGGLGGSSLSE